MRIGLLRHGEVEGGSCFRGSTDHPLSRVGLAQMRAATAADTGWQRVISSPLSRCTEFATEYAAAHGLPLDLEPRLQEMHFGDWEGRTAAELMAADPGALDRFWQAPHRHTPPGGEPLADFQQRVLTAWDERLERHAGEDLLLVTHGGVIRVLLCLVSDHPLERLLDFEVPYAALRRIRVAGEAGQRRYLLEEEQP